MQTKPFHAQMTVMEFHMCWGWSLIHLLLRYVIRKKLHMLPLHYLSGVNAVVRMNTNATFNTILSWWQCNDQMLSKWYEVVAQNRTTFLFSNKRNWLLVTKCVKITSKVDLFPNCLCIDITLVHHWVKSLFMLKKYTGKLPKPKKKKKKNLVSSRDWNEGKGAHNVDNKMEIHEGRPLLHAYR